MKCSICGGTVPKCCWGAYEKSLKKARTNARNRRLRAVKSHSAQEYSEAHGEATGLSIALSLFRDL